MTATFDVAVIGAGAMGERHVAGWQAAGHRVRAVVDVDACRAETLAKRFGVAKALTDYRDALAHPAIDIVSVCLPLAFHAPVSVAAAEHGKHVFCEKPLARSFAEATAIEEAVARAGVQFGIGFQRSTTRDVEILRTWVAEGRFGRPLMIRSEAMAPVRPKIAMHDGRGNMGPIMDVCGHSFLMWQNFLQAKAETVYAAGTILANGRKELASIEELAIDTAAITIRYETGDIANLVVSWGLEDANGLPRHLDTMFGPRGGVEIDPRFKLVVHQDGKTETFETGHTNEELYQRQLQVFADAVDRGEPPPVGLQQGKDALAVTLAALASIETGRVVEVDYAS